MAEHINTQVDVTELMGSEVYLYLLVGSKTFIARVDPRTSARVGQKMDVAFNMDNVHFFSRENEATIR
jgi:multiple sugar transport system ATP-binding protein